MGFVIGTDLVDFNDLKSLERLSADKPFLNQVIDFLQEWYSSSNKITVHTSGSTGNPKQIELSKWSMRSSAQKTAKYFQFEQGDVALLGLSAKYIAGKMMIVRAIICKLDLILVKPQANPLKSVSQTIDFVPLTPHQLMTIWNESPSSFNNIDTILLGGSPVNYKHMDILPQIHSNVYQGFGMTETITHIAVRSLTNHEQKYRLLDGVLVKAGDKGRLIIEADHIDQSIITNDLVEIYEDQSFKWLGRLDNVINTGGIKVYPETIESKLHPSIGDCAFFVHKQFDEALGQKVVLLIESDEKSIVDKLDKSFELLDRYERPKHIYYVDSFVYTETGKINRKATFANK